MVKHFNLEAREHIVNSKDYNYETRDQDTTRKTPFPVQYPEHTDPTSGLHLLLSRDVRLSPLVDGVEPRRLHLRLELWTHLVVVLGLRAQVPLPLQDGLAPLPNGEEQLG